MRHAQSDIKLETRPSTFRGQTKFVEKDPRRYVVGAGSPPDMAKISASANKREGLGSFLDLVNQSMNNPVYNMDVIEQVRWTMLGPQTDASVQANFGANIDLFGSGKSVPGIDFVETTLAQTGQTQTYFIACYLGFHMEPEPLCFTARGNAWTHPVTGVAAPPSPDVFTQNDRANTALSAAIAAGTQIMLPAVLEWGWWANYVCWHMARAYNLRWKIGQHTNIMDEVLRHTAYMPPSAQEGSASSSEVDVCEFVDRLNDRYDSLGSALDFLKVNFLRIGSATTGGVNVGRFTPTRDFEFVGATYGGMDLRSTLGMLQNNREFRKLNVPYVIKPGVPIGLILEENDSAQANIMRDYLSITNGQGGAIPPVVVDDANILATPTASGGNVMLERTLDGADVSQAVDSGRVVFKGGELKLTLPIKGFEVTEDWYTQMSVNADIRQVVMDACGVRFAMQGA
jgi:hypothetical protein